MASSLRVGQHVTTGSNHWEIVDIDADGRFEMKVLVQAVDVNFARHIKSGREYLAYRHFAEMPGEEVWEIPPEELKDASCRVLLCATDSTDPSLELAEE